MRTKHGTKFVQEGQYTASLGVEWIDTGWGPCLSLDDAQKLDDVREALRRGDFEAAARFGEVYQLTPIAD